MNIYDIVIIGAGPSGIMAAISAAESGRSILLIEKNEKIGKKLLATGNGRCNLTNINVSNKNYSSDDLNFVESVISQLDQNKTIDFFESLGVMLKVEDKGRVFPRTNQASTILHVLSDQLNRKNITLLTGKTVLNVTNKDQGWEVKLNDKIVCGKKLLITTGGKAAHYLGSSGDGLFWAERIGHKISPIHAALVPINILEKWPKDVMGLKVNGKARIVNQNKILLEKSGDILFTHFGLSGPAIMGLSSSISKLIAKGLKPKISLDLFPEKTEKSLDELIKKVLNVSGAKQLKNALLGVLPHNLIGQIIKIAEIPGEQKSAEITRSDREKLITTLKNIEFTPVSTRPLKEAQVTAGGISTAEVNKRTLESKICPTLFFAGEILDVDGDSGGYNLQWAWSSGYVAGKGMTDQIG